MSTRIKKRSNMDSITYLTTVKTEYEKQLTNVLEKSLYKILLNIYSDSKKFCKENKKKDIMKQFQNHLKKITNWDKEHKVYYTDKIIKDSSCSYLDKLLSAVFISSTKLLSATASRKKYDVSVIIPDPNVFLYKVLRNISRQFYTNPYLFCDYDISPWDQQRNLRDALTLINEIIKDTIRNSLPFDEILESYLSQVNDDSDEEEYEDDTHSISSEIGSLIDEEEQISIEDLEEDGDDGDDGDDESEINDDNEEHYEDDVFQEEMLEGDNISDHMSDNNSDIVILEEMADGDDRFSFFPIVDKPEKKSFDEIIKEESESEIEEVEEVVEEHKTIKVNKKSLERLSKDNKINKINKSNKVFIDDSDLDDELN